ncbi:MAG: fucose isomerase [Clostridia bacterium]|nr:fucose isomerase [Clostridia bacterium]
MINIPEVKIGIVAVSRDCFPMALSKKRREKVAEECKKINCPVFEAQTLVENENDALTALNELNLAGVNALVVFLGNFGPEGPETMLAQKFNGPVMFVAAAEESDKDLIDGRGDAYCGMLSMSVNMILRKLNPYIPEYPVGTADEVAAMISDFAAIARVYIGVKNLKIIAFGPRPYDFVACNAPIKQLYEIGVEVQENSELDLFASFNEHKGDSRIPAVAKEMAKELGKKGNNYPSILEKLAQYEITLLDWAEKNRGASKYVVFANKCWPAFQTQFGFVPCYVNSRLASRGIPVACEVDIYGALSEFILQCATLTPATLLDINNTVPKDMYEKNAIDGYRQTDLFMGFHCGNTASCLIKNPAMKYQLIMKRSLEPDGEPDISRGTLEGTIKNGEVTIFRLHGSADGELRTYMAQGEVLNVDPKSFGSIGVFGIKEMGRFYRHVLIQNGFPHHAGIGFAHCGKTLFAAMRLLGVENIYYNQPREIPYPTENPFTR